METRLGSTGLKTRKYFEHIMLKINASKGVGFEVSGSNGASEVKQKGIVRVVVENRVESPSSIEMIDLTRGSRTFTKHSNLDCHCFKGVTSRIGDVLFVRHSI